MPSNENEQTVRQIYKDFVGGNINGVINALADNVKWSVPGYPENPNAGNFVGKNEVSSFFQNLSKHLEYTKFEPKEYFNSGNIVAVIGYQESKAIDTGKKLSGDWIMRWEFNNNGKAIDFKYYDDTLKTAKAYR